MLIKKRGTKSQLRKPQRSESCHMYQILNLNRLQGVNNTPPHLLKYLYQARRVSGHAYEY